MTPTSLTCRSIVPGTASGRLIYADVGLSFMGGVDPNNGLVIDSHHPLRGRDISGAVLAIPSGRGSCAGSLVIFELLLNGHAPRALIFQHKETILTLGVLIAAELFQRGIPVVALSGQDFSRLSLASFASIDSNRLSLSDRPLDESPPQVQLPPLDVSGMQISAADLACLNGDHGEAARVALRLILRTAQLEGATSLIDIDMAHIDGCFYQGPGGLAFARRLIELGAKVRVPSTMNAICVDRRGWRSQGVAPALGLASDELAEAYVAMGVQPSYTCAPYLLSRVPRLGQQIAWGESNAVVFANSVLGARTLKYPDHLDILVAITGRAPNADCHRAELRHATVHIDLERPTSVDDAYFAVLGYHVGKASPHDIPVITGLEGLPITHDHLKTFGAAFATTSAAAMFHIVSVTPEASSLYAATGSCVPSRVSVSQRDLRATWEELNTATTPEVSLVSLGNPHFSLSEIADLSRLCRGRTKDPSVAMIITCGRDVHAQAEDAGYLDEIRRFGGTFLNDTCWCLIGAPIVNGAMRAITTNSAKYAHYGPAAVGKTFHLLSLASCVDAACNGFVDMGLPPWLS